MIYITDRKFDIIDNEKRGHGIAEVRVVESGRPKQDYAVQSKSSSPYENDVYPICSLPIQYFFSIRS